MDLGVLAGLAMACLAVAPSADALEPAPEPKTGWDAAGIPAGVYVVRLQAGASVRSLPITLVR